MIQFLEIKSLYLLFKNFCEDSKGGGKFLAILHKLYSSLSNNRFSSEIIFQIKQILIPLLLCMVGRLSSSKGS